MWIDSYVAFSNKYNVDQSQIPLGKTNVSIVAVFFWSEYILNKFTFKDKKYIIFIPTTSPVLPGTILMLITVVCVVSGPSEVLTDWGGGGQMQNDLHIFFL